MTIIDVSKLTDQELVDLKKRMERAGERLTAVRQNLDAAIASIEAAVDRAETAAKWLLLNREGTNEAWVVAGQLNELLGASGVEARLVTNTLFEGRLATCPRCGGKRIVSQGPTLVQCSSCGQGWFDEGEVLTDTVRNDVKNLARIVRSFVNGGGLTAGDFRQLDALAHGEPTEPGGAAPSEVEAEPDDRDLDFEYEDAKGNRIDATGAVVRRGRLFRVFLGRK